MYAIVGQPRFTGEVNDQDELRILHEVVAACERSGGFRGLCSVRVNDKEFLNVFFWESREDGARGLTAAAEVVRAIVRNELSAALDGPPSFTSGEVLYAYGIVQDVARE